MLIREGDITFFEDVNGMPTPITAITQVGLYDIESNENVIPNERYKETPEVFVQPRSIKTFEISGIDVDQSIEINTPTITPLSAGKYQISVSGGLKTAAGGYTAVAPLEIYRTNSDDSNPTWAVPVKGITSATVYGYVSGRIKVYQSGNTSFYGINYSVRTGIGTYQNSANYWGTVVSGNHRQTGRTQVIASVSGAVGNYLHIAATLASDGSSMSISGNEIDREPSFKLLGARCSGGGAAVSGNAVFTAVVVGR